MIIVIIIMQVGSGDDYRLRVGGFNDALSTLGDSLTHKRRNWYREDEHNNINGMAFSTK